MRVEVSGRQFSFLPQCACCGGAPQGVLAATASKSRGKKKVITTTMQWDSPYCARCLSHVQAMNAANALVVGGVMLSLCVGFVLWVAVAHLFGLLVVLVGSGASIYFSQAALKRAAALKTPSCVCIGAAVALHEFDGSRQAFEIASPVYALAFMQANARKLVNLSGQGPAVVEIERAKLNGCAANGAQIHSLTSWKHFLF